ncbi:uncharacterized protein LOC129957369 isoform X1 [Argiope bruennichi]|uniref:uncharacterized protein LOC129957369 isoform X1 n=1 Tax=Argiope bruennichi TaxID=94029 RepID=UPI0024957754|nr:uncharacterized protein LOC129957369 isoform X1 [Argiope bruennichi]
MGKGIHLSFWTSTQLIILISLLKEVLPITVTDVRLVSQLPYVISGEPAVLTCHYITAPNEVVTEVEWEKDGTLVYLWTLDEPPVAKDVLEGHADLSVSSPSTLTINSVNMHMQGTYICRVRTNGKTSQNDFFLMVIVDACQEGAWKTHTDMISCTETVSMHCIGIFPKPSPTCGVYADKSGRFLNSVPFDSVNKLANGTFEVSFNRKFEIKEWINHTDISFRCHMMFLGTPWRRGIVHKMFGESGCKEDPPRVQNGYYNMTEEKSCWGFPAEGTRIQYHCEEGHKLLGTALYTCADGSWVPEGVIVEGDYEIPICENPDSGGSERRSTQIAVSIALLILFIFWTSHP